MPQSSGSLGNRFPATLRIKRRETFQRTFRRGKVVADHVLVLHGLIADEVASTLNTGDPSSELSCLGISIAKKVGHAPKRNRWKRLIREAYRTQKYQLPRGLWLIARPRKGAEPNLASIERSLRSLSRKLAKRLDWPA